MVVPQEQLERIALGMAVHKRMEMLLEWVAMQQRRHPAAAAVATGVVGLQVSLLNLVELPKVAIQVVAAALATQRQRLRCRCTLVGIKQVLVR
jgi:hypothetical protein